MEKLQISKWFSPYKNEDTSSITLKREGNKKMILSYCGNLDLYFRLSNFDNAPTFLIGKDNYAVYAIFDKLYNNVMNGILFSDPNEIERLLFECELFDEDYHEALREKEKAKLKSQKEALEHAAKTGLISGNEIIWRSDDFNHDIAPYFKITKLLNAYQITFKVPTPSRSLSSEEDFFLEEATHRTISVRLRNSGSFYHMFNAPFMEAYNSLLKLDLENPQIHIEEYLIDREIKEGHSLELILKRK